MIVKVHNLAEAKRLAEACIKCSCDIDASTGSRVCDAKSLLGIMTLDLSSDIELIFNCSDEDLSIFTSIISENYKVG